MAHAGSDWLILVAAGATGSVLLLAMSLRINAPAAINTAIRTPTTNDVTGCRLGLTSFDPALFCAAPMPNQKRSLSIDATRRLA